LAAFLQTFNYTLYVVAYLQTKTPSLAKLSQTLLGLLNYKRGTVSEKLGALNTAPVPGAPSSVASLATLLSQTRTTLRLFGLFPLYAWMRTLLQGPKEGQDTILYGIAFTQCAGYIGFQFLENLALLTDSGVVPRSYSARFQAGGVSNTAKIYLWSYRAWLVGVSCDFFRLGREAQLSAAKRTGKSTSEKSLADVKEDVQAQDAKWWNDLIVPIAWLPVALHFSKEGGIPGMNLGIMGAGGLVAGLGRTRGLWAQTADV
jgi:hypothetical protein